MRQSQQSTQSGCFSSSNSGKDTRDLREMSLPLRFRGALYANRWALTTGTLLIFTFTFCYGKVFLTLMNKWWSDDSYSYGFLIPLISLYFVWMRRDRLFSIQILPNYTGGGIILFFGLGMFLVGRAGGILIFEELSLIVTITGLVLFLMGTSYLRILWFPIAYLLFMIPIWEILTDRLHLPFQNFSAKIGVILLQLAGVPALRQGIYIELPNITLEVAKACSGVNYLISVIAIGIPLAYFFLKKWYKRVFLISIAIVIVILTNSLRVALIGILAYFNISEVLHGPYHILQAMSVSIGGFIALFIVTWILSEKSASSFSHYQHSQLFSGDCKLKYTGLPVFFIFLLVGAYMNFYQPSPVPLKMDLRLFPYQIGGWEGRKSEPDYLVYRTLGINNDLSRTYKTAYGEEIKLYIGYYESQAQGKELINYQTSPLYSNATKEKIILTPDREMEVVKLVERKGKINRLILFWYDINGRIATDSYKAKAYTIWDAFIKGRSNGAVIMVSGEFETDEEYNKVFHNAGKFIQHLASILPEYLP